MLTFDVGSLNYDPPRIKEFQRRVVEIADTTPGVKVATLTSDIPLFSDISGRTVFPEGLTGSSSRNGMLVLLSYVGPDYLSTMGIRLVHGQDFDSSVRQDSRQVAIINETGARQFWPNEDPIGKRFKFFNGDWITVVGVAHDSKYRTLGEDATPYLYLPLIQNVTPQVTLFFRTHTDPRAILGSVRNRVQVLDPNLPLTNNWAIQEVINQRLWAARFGASLLSIFAVVAVTLCAVGINGVVGYTVGRRVREIGIRLALGARPGNVLFMVLRQSAVTVAIGLLVGLVCAVLLARLIVSLLYSVSVEEPMTFVGTIFVLILVGLLASYFPARRAAKVDPIVALHNE
jgi:predicted permease